MSLDFGIGGYAPMFHRTVNDVSKIQVPGSYLTDNVFENLRLIAQRKGVPCKQEQIQIIDFPSISESFWELTPEVTEELMSYLTSDTMTNVTFQTKLTLNRNSAINNEVEYTYVRQHEPDDEYREYLKKVASDIENHLPVVLNIDAVLPGIIKIPGTTGTPDSLCNEDTDDIEALSKDGCHINCLFGSKSSKSGYYWWIEQDSLNETQHVYGPMRIVFVNTPVSEEGNVLSFVVNKGLIGLYALFAVQIFGFLKPITRNFIQRIMFEDLPDPSRLQRLCKDIVLARMDGDLLLEEELSNELFQIFRNPESIIYNTRIVVPQEDDEPIDENEPDDFEDDMDGQVSED